MTALLSILGVSALFVLSAFVARRRSCERGECGTCRACGWWKETNHVPD
jgi:hypothetical protein